MKLRSWNFFKDVNKHDHYKSCSILYVLFFWSSLAFKCYILEFTFVYSNSLALITDMTNQIIKPRHMQNMNYKKLLHPSFFVKILSKSYHRGCPTNRKILGTWHLSFLEPPLKAAHWCHRGSPLHLAPEGQVYTGELNHFYTHSQI